MNRIPSDLHDVCGGDGCSDGLQHQYIELLEGIKRKMTHEMLLRDSESTVHRIKILMESQSGDYISRESNPGFHDLS